MFKKKSLLSLLIIVSVLSLSTFIPTKSASNENFKDNQNFYYSCIHNYGVGGTFYQEFPNLEQCRKDCNSGFCVRVNQNANKLDDYLDQAIVASDINL